MAHLQRPIPSGFDRTTTAEEALSDANLSGRRIMITGGYSGIGLETARVLSAAGATLVIPARNIAKAHEALRDFPHTQIHPMDLADPRSIDAFVREFIGNGDALDLLIANAGIMATPLTRDVRGYEGQLPRTIWGISSSWRDCGPVCAGQGGRVSSCFHPARIVLPTSISTTRTIFTVPMTGGKLTDSRKPLMRCLPLAWTAAARRTECALSLFIQALSSLTSSVTSR